MFKSKKVGSQVPPQYNPPQMPSVAKPKERKNSTMYMNTIFKYNFGPISPGIKTVTIDNEFVCLLDIQEQDGDFVMWAHVGTNMKPQNVTIDVRWTGEVAPNKTYIKTIQGSDGLVYHIYI